MPQELPLLNYLYSASNGLHYVNAYDLYCHAGPLEYTLVWYFWLPDLTLNICSFVYVFAGVCSVLALLKKLMFQRYLCLTSNDDSTVIGLIVFLIFL